MAGDRAYRLPIQVLFDPATLYRPPPPGKVAAWASPRPAPSCPSPTSLVWFMSEIVREVRA